GLDPDGPIGCFLDLTPIEKALADAAQREETPDSEQPQQPEAPPSDTQEKPQGTVVTPARLTPDAPDYKLPEGMGVPQLPPFAPPALAAMALCLDSTKVEAFVKEVIAKAPNPDAYPLEDVEADGVTIHCYGKDKFCYYFADSWLVAGNSVELLKGVAARLKSPVQLRYGTPECPHMELDEIVCLARTDKLVGPMKSYMSALAALDPSMAMFMGFQEKAMEETVKAYSGTDPVVMTLSINEAKIETLFRLDFAKHPNVLAMSGQPAPLQLATKLPESTLALLSFRITPEAKDQFMKTWQGAMPPEMQSSPGMAPAMGMINTVVGMIGDELTVGVTGAKEGMPQLIVMLGVKDVNQAQGFLQMFGMPVQSDEKHAEVDVMTFPLPLPVPLYYAFPGQVLLVADDLDQIKAAIDLIKTGGNSRLFETLDPALDAAAPRYSVFLVKGKIIDDVIKPAKAAFEVSVEPRADPVLDKVTQLLKEVRVTQEVRDNWLEGRMTISLNSPETAAPNPATQ
ncbi:MAG: hypothetical protein HY706_00545, partial [Candidatus Hydrogenedentes bacterium]|nr:hypothetical protein [Candidatus Hydrogenedentota bacterium]